MGIFLNGFNKVPYILIFIQRVLGASSGLGLSVSSMQLAVWGFWFGGLRLGLRMFGDVFSCHITSL